MEPPPIPTSVSSTLNSEKRLYPGTNSRIMDAGVVEIPSRIAGTPITFKDKGITLHEVIEIDEDEDCADIMFIDGADKKNKGKAIQTIFDDYFVDVDKEATVNNFLVPSGVGAVGSANRVESSKTFDTSAHNIIDLDSPGSDQSYDDGDYNFLFSDDFMDVDKFAQLQSYFDNANIPPGIEAPVPWLPDPPEVPIHFSKDSKFAVGSTLQISHKEARNHTHAVDLPSNRLLKQTSQSKIKATTLQRGLTDSKSPVGVESARSRWQKPFHNKKKTIASSSSINYNSTNQLDEVSHAFGVKTPSWETSPVTFATTSFPSHTNTTNYPHGVEPSLSLIQPKLNFQSSPFDHTAYTSIFNSIMEVPGIEDHGHSQNKKNVTDDNYPTNVVRAISTSERDEILRKFQFFKQFDTAEDYADHHYTSKSSSAKLPSKNWVKRIQEEWKILEKDLPEINVPMTECFMIKVLSRTLIEMQDTYNTIFVRVYETRMDLLRAVIIGAEGTPYHDGLFFFDIFFPSSYPKGPPHVHYHSGGLRLNPNLYNCGKVCLSLLNTWSGGEKEKWIPGVSTILQVLVSIQGLILNAKPYFNEPGYAPSSGSPIGEMRSQLYNETTFILSLKTMMYTIRRPPKHFEDFVVGHFYNRAHNILVSCKAYMDGAQVGCLVKGGVQDVDAGDKSCSKPFKESLFNFMHTLVEAFSKIGADCENVLSPTGDGSTRCLSEVPA